jgi:Protein of unknown function (DUF2490)
MIARIINTALAAALLLASTAYAETIEDGRYWLNISLLGNLPAQDWNWTLDLRPRWRDEGRNFDQFIASGFINKNLSPKFALGLGIDHVQNHPAGLESFEENRLVPQMQYKFDDIAGIKLQSRTRFEFRTREDFDDTAFRLREMIRASYPLSFNPKLSLLVFDELMINFNNTDWNVRRGIDQNRVFAGVAYQANTQTGFEFGYLNQYVNTRTIDRENHILTATFRYNFH